MNSKISDNITQWVQTTSDLKIESTQTVSTNTILGLFAPELHIVDPTSSDHNFIYRGPIPVIFVPFWSLFINLKYSMIIWFQI